MESFVGKYDVALSFAGEDRAYAEEVAKALRSLGVRVFYDKFEEAELWGKDLKSHLHDIYLNQAMFAVIFCSIHYRRKRWTNHERESAQERASLANPEYILPARFDDTPIPGIGDTIAYFDLRRGTPFELCQLIAKKIGKNVFRARDVNDIGFRDEVLNMSDMTKGVVCGFGDGDYVNYRTAEGYVKYAPADELLVIKTEGLSLPS